MRIKILLVLCTFVICSVLSEEGRFHSISSDKPESNELWERWHFAVFRDLQFEILDNYFIGLRDFYGFNGAVLIAQDNRILYEGALGYSKFPSKYVQGEILSLNNSFQLASVSKIFTATAVLTLQDSGLLDISEPVKKYLPLFPYENITIENLLSHRSGLSRYMGIAGEFYKDVYTPLTYQKVYEMYDTHKPIAFFEPNTGFNYCNTNYVFLAKLVEEVGGKPFGEYMKEVIFEPAKMTHSTIFRRNIDSLQQHMVEGYKGWGRRKWIAPNDYVDGVVGDKGMYASVRDIYKFDCALNDHLILKSETLASAFNPRSPRKINNYGLGWRIKRMADRNITYHFGWWRGFHTCYIKDSRYNRTYIVLTNQDIPGKNPSFWNIYDTVNDLLDQSDDEKLAQLSLF